MVAVKGEQLRLREVWHGDTEAIAAGPPTAYDGRGAISERLPGER